MSSQGEHDWGEGRPECLESLRQYHENERQWAARRQFLARHMNSYPGRKMDQLIALSVVWSNIVFIGNRYGDQLTQKVHEMAEGIEIGEMPSFELVPGARAAKRPSSSEAGGQASKKKFGPRPRFEPVHFVVSTIEEDKVFQKTQETNANLDGKNLCESLHPSDVQPQASNLCVSVSDHSDTENNTEMQSTCPYIYDADDTDDQTKNDAGNFMTKMEQDYSAKFESHYSTLGKDFRSNVLDGWKGAGQQGRKGIGFVKPPKKTGRTGMEKQGSANNSMARVVHPSDKSGLIKQLSTIVKQNLVNPKMASDSRHINFTHVLTHSIQACKTNPEYIYVPIKELPPGSVPKHKKIPPDGYACEVRYQDVYLATGFSWSKIGARDRSAELAIQLLQKPTVDVATVQRKCGRGYRDDVVACSSDTCINDFPPALKQEDNFVNDTAVSSQQISEATKGASSRPWSEFILTENACDAIGILNNSATFNKMTVDYKYDMMPNNVWRCAVYVQDNFIAEGFGNKKNSKHAAAEAAVKILKAIQPNTQRVICANNTGESGRRELKDVVVYENAANPVCTLNDTAQFNKVSIEYVFERVSGLDWRCKVLIEQQFVAEAVGVKKTVKHEAAEAAVNVLKRTQPVVVNKKGAVEDAISRHQIKGLSGEEAYKQQIKEDNIGNQLLRKMGWTGGGLGKEGEGIAEPIAVKEQFSREGLGLMTTHQKITKRDIEQMISNYVSSCNQDDLTFSRELTNEERKFIHQIAQKYGLKSKSHGQGTERFLVVSRKRSKQDLIHQLKQEGQVGSYALLMPHK